MYIQTAAIINLLFVPTLAIYLHYKKNDRALVPCLDLLFHYCIAASFNFVIAKLVLSLVNKVVPTVTSVDSAHYAVVALFSAWLLPKLYVVAQNVSVKIEITKVATEGKQKRKAGKKGEGTGNEDTKKP